jgi:hypothetical protein
MNAATEINGLHRVVMAKLRDATDAAIRIGELLTAQKRLCVYGT